MVKLHGENEKETKWAKIPSSPDEHFMYRTNLKQSLGSHSVLLMLY